MFKKYGFKILTILIVLLVSTMFAYTHSGRTDKYGGHYDRKNGGYHFHNSGTVPRTTIPDFITPTVPRTTTPDFDIPDVTIPDFTIPKLKSIVISRGSDSYFPTKLEWLTLQLNAKYRLFSLDNSFIGMYHANKDTDTIIVELIYHPSVTHVKRADILDLLKNAVKLEATRLGWQDWVKTEEKLELLQQ